MPRQGQSVETCIITRWFKSRGDRVSAGDILFSYETDKAAFDMESPADGILIETFFDEGAEVPVLTNVAVIGSKGEEIDQYYPGNSPARENEPPGKPETESASISGSIQDTGTAPGNKITISPRAKRMAEEKGINYKNLRGSGPNGRIILSDIERTASAEAGPGDKAPAPGADFSDQPLSSVRKLIAKAMHASLQNSAQVSHHMSADARSIMEFRRRIKERIASGEEKHDITINDMVCWCVIKALRKWPEANSHFLGDTIRTFHKVNLGIAVDTERGLMVPSVRNADEMDLYQLSKELKSVAGLCRRGSIDPELIRSTSASFTISNLGNYGVEMFTPVINLPQVAILGVCTIINRPADLGNNTFGFVPYIGLSLTYDHRALDGGPATLFLREIKYLVESFEY